MSLQRYTLSLEVSLVDAAVNLLIVIIVYFVLLLFIQ